jgi:hypothetical protein
MSRNYQMHDMPREEADRFDAYDRAQMAREEMARETEVRRARLIEEAKEHHRPLSSCEIAKLRSRGHNV